MVIGLSFANAVYVGALGEDRKWRKGRIAGLQSSAWTSAFADINYVYLLYR
jgi:hypothetical protein